VRTRIFFATDIHGSDACFLKFLNSARFYKADVLIMGGDITGKMIVPEVQRRDGVYEVSFLGVNHVLRSERELVDLERRISLVGYYPYRTTQEGLEELRREEGRLDELFSRLMVERLERWMRTAEERLRDVAAKVFVTGGNDDRFVIDSVLRSSSRLVDPEGTVTKLDRVNEMVSCAWTNPTPWKTPRECSEDELYHKILDMTSMVTDIGGCVFNTHAPPVNSGLDTCPKLDENLRPVFAGGQPVTFGAGSVAVRKIIEERQPLLGLHGHIHESRGVAKIGRTICLNPGSEYSEGILRGVIVDLEDKKVKSYLFTSG
jgi:Icc-related predicted phosphoesterase